MAFPFRYSRTFPAWLSARGVSLLFSTYQTGKLFAVGVAEDGGLAVYERTLERCMGLTVVETGFLVASAYQIWRFNNALETGERHEGHDAVFVPRQSWVTGDVDAHDLAAGPDGRPIFANTLFSCLSEVSETHSFRPLWVPPFITKLAPEDRCHLNGFTLNGPIQVVSMLSRSDVAAGWRDHRRSGGVLMSITDGETIATGLSMPHAPRWHEGSLYLLNSGSGEIGTVDVESGRFEPLAFIPGFLRGLSFIDGHAVVGASLPRDVSFADLPISDRLERASAAPRCGIFIVSLKTGDTVDWLDCAQVASELYDVGVLPGVMRPKLVGFKGDEIRRTISIGGTR